jgi:aspartate/methionine/tyrosine aminotransferase
MAHHHRAANHHEHFGPRIGWRVGWAAGPRSVKGDIALAPIYNTTVASGFGQIGALAALT